MEIIETRGDYRVALYLDDTMGNPRDEYDHTAHVVSVPDRSYLPPDKDGGPLAAKWQRCLDRYDYRNTWDGTSNAIELFERYCRTIGVLTLLDTPIDGPTSVWYMMPADIQEAANYNADPMAILGGERDEYRAWAEGSVYGYQIEQRIVWHKADHEDADTMVTWECIDGVGGYYGWEDAESEARSALESVVAEAAKS